jgi:S-adenosylmethionine hydrolase
MKRTRNISRRSTRKTSLGSSLIALLTDFGLSDHYVGTVKGVICSIHPSVTIVDITHEVLPQHVRQAGYLLWSAYRFFPTGTVFATVVDPGVGSKRRILAVRTPKYIFLAPDNMLLDFVLSEEKILEAVEVKTEKNPYILSPISHTFHGRDIFAPVAAYLARGISLKEIGNTIKIHPAMSPFVDADKAKSETGEILHIDHFGNIVTNIRAEMQALSSLTINKIVVSRWISNYSEAPVNTPCLISGSSGVAELVVKNGNAQQLMNVKVGDTILLNWK